MSSDENRLSDAPPADPAPAAVGAAAVPNPPLVCPKILPLPAGADAVDPKPLPNPPPVLLAVEVKLNPEAEPNPEGAAGVLEVGALKEKEDAVEEPNPEGGCVGAAEVLPKPVEDGAAGAEEPNPPPAEAKLKELAWAGAGAPKPMKGKKMAQWISMSKKDNYDK